MIPFVMVVCGILLANWCTIPLMADSRRLLEYAPAPVDNPLKGLVPYQGDVRHRFPHSMEFNYLPYAALVKDYEEFDWQPLEKMLDDIAYRGHQAVFRIFLEYPRKRGAIPDFLIRDGLRVHKYVSDKTPMETPDYEDKNLRRSLKAFIAALGRKYDGDPRIGFITAGLLGYWGEWHTYPRTELFASKVVQQEVMDAYESAFRTTPVLLRYPAGDNHYAIANNADRNFGYHDDSFAWATLHTGKRGDEWFFMSALRDAEALTKWQTHPIGGEIRPEAWGHVFDAQPTVHKIQNFRQCVEETHVSWLMDSGMFRSMQTPDRIRRAEEEVRRMGYEFHVRAITTSGPKTGRLRVDLEIENRGVAPFYYDWRAEYGLLAQSDVVRTWKGSGTLKGLLPGEKPRVWTEELDVSDLKPGRYILAVRVPNPLPTGHPIRFANVTQDADAETWLSLETISIH